MNLGKITLGFLFCFLFISCSENKEILDYNDAKEVYANGFSKEKIISLFGEPVGVVDFEGFETWYYEPVDPVKVIEPGGEFIAFSIDFKEHVSVKLNPVIITRR